MAVNDAYRILPTADHLYSCDYRWAKVHCADIARDFEGIWWTQDVQWPADSPAAQWGLRQVKSINKPGLSRDPEVIHQGGNSGYQAINLAYGQLRAERIILLGYDMDWTGGKSHFFGDHPEGLINANPTKFVANFRSIKPEDYGIEIINCSRHTALDAFPRCKLEDLCAD